MMVKRLMSLWRHRQKSVENLSGVDCRKRNDVLPKQQPLTSNAWLSWARTAVEVEETAADRLPQRLTDALPLDGRQVHHLGKPVHSQPDRRHRVRHLNPSPRRFGGISSVLVTAVSNKTHFTKPFCKVQAERDAREPRRGRHPPAYWGRRFAGLVAGRVVTAGQDLFPRSECTKGGTPR